MRELENDQHVSLQANVSRFPFIFFNLSGFSTLLVTTCLLRGLFTRLLPWHYNDIQYQNNIVYYKSYILRNDNLNLLEDKTQLS